MDKFRLLKLYTILIIFCSFLTVLITLFSFYLKVPFIFLLLVGYLFYVFGDLHSTYYSLNKGAKESNLFARFIFNKTSIIKGGFILKNICITPFLIVILFYESVPILMEYFLLSFLISLGLVLTVNNYMVSRKL
jgi:hypothetical protein